jgi:Spy/CpxP family protein refolding chaperone
MYIHPRVIELSRNARAIAISIGAGCAPDLAASAAECGPGRRSQEECCGPEVESFGVKRPLRFLAYKLQLTEPQVSELAAILDELKIERAQAAVDDRRTLSAFADALTGDAFDNTKATEGATLREKSTDRLGDAVVKALARIHELLTPEQRARFAYMIRTGTIRL